MRTAGLFALLSVYHWMECFGSNGQIVNVIISWDAFKPDYIGHELTPHIEKFRSDEVYAEYVESKFPTITFTNHFTVATGHKNKLHFLSL